MPRVENPDALAAWAYLEPPDGFGAVELRGGLVFDSMATMGLRVQRVPGTDATLGPGSGVSLAIHRPWTHIFMMASGQDLVPMFEVMPWWCSVIMDCHFPIMDMEVALGSDETLIAIIDQKDQIMANLAMAEAVTVPNKDWAARLAEVNPNTFYLPDLTAANADAFAIKLFEIANTAMATKLARVRDRKDLIGE